MVKNKWDQNGAEFAYITTHETVEEYTCEYELFSKIQDILTLCHDIQKTIGKLKKLTKVYHILRFNCNNNKPLTTF